mmetsp:Transcript_7681/g.18739  ORF Transcript_7681/g.18739 Transcript_7681/m.18739 type:complete len:154 (+) Transcript_7681:140-601(+)
MLDFEPRGRVYIWGFGVVEDAKRGSGGGVKCMMTPSLLDTMAAGSVRRIHTSSSITIALSQSGRVYQWSHPAARKLQKGAGQRQRQRERQRQRQRRRPPTPPARIILPLPAVRVPFPVARGRDDDSVGRKFLPRWVRSRRSTVRPGLERAFLL